MAFVPALMQVPLIPGRRILHTGAVVVIPVHCTNAFTIKELFMNELFAAFSPKLQNVNSLLNVKYIS